MRVLITFAVCMLICYAHALLATECPTVDAQGVDVYEDLYEESEDSYEETKDARRLKLETAHSNVVPTKVPAVGRRK
jgi:hypothetical protein